MLTEIQGTLVQPSYLGALELDRTLVYYDGPKIILRKNRSSQLYLAWWSDADEYLERWIYVPISAHRLQRVLCGSLNSREAIDEPEGGFIIVADIDFNGDFSRIVLTDSGQIPSDALPTPDARLNISIPEDIAQMPTKDRAHVLDVKLRGRSSDTGRVGARDMRMLLINLQRLFDALGQAAEGGSTDRGQIPDAVREKTTFELIGSYTGSFGMRLETQEDDLFGDSLAKESLNALFELLCWQPVVSDRSSPA